MCVCGGGGGGGGSVKIIYVLLGGRLGAGSFIR